MFKLLKLFIDFRDYFVLIILIVISLSLISVNSTNNISGFRAVIIGGVGYLQNLLSWIPNPGALQNENKTLINLNIQLSSDVAIMRKALQENNELRSMLELKHNSQYKLIASDVTNKRSMQMRNFVMINKGEYDGVKMGMSVCSEAGLVGSIISSNSQFAMVELLNNRNIKIPAVISESDVNGIVVWEGDEYLYLRNVSKSLKVNVGETVLTSTFSDKYPSNLSIGKVDKVVDDPGSHFSKIRIKPATSFFSFSQVFVVDYLPNPKEIELVKEVENKVLMLERRK